MTADRKKANSPRQQDRLLTSPGGTVPAVIEVLQGNDSLLFVLAKLALCLGIDTSNVANSCNTHSLH